MINPIRILIGVMLISLFNSTTASAHITIDGNTIHVETNNYKVQFDRGVITQLHNKLTDETYTLPPDININRGIRGETSILIRDRFVWTWHGNTVEAHKINPHQAEFLFRDGGSEIRGLSLSIRRPTTCSSAATAMPLNLMSTGCSWGLETLTSTI